MKTIWLRTALVAVSVVAIRAFGAPPDPRTTIHTVAFEPPDWRYHTHPVYRYDSVAAANFTITYATHWKHGSSTTLESIEGQIARMDTAETNTGKTVYVLTRPNDMTGGSYKPTWQDADAADLAEMRAILDSDTLDHGQMGGFYFFADARAGAEWHWACHNIQHIRTHWDTTGTRTAAPNDIVFVLGLLGAANESDGTLDALLDTIDVFFPDSGDLKPVWGIEYYRFREDVGCSPFPLHTLNEYCLDLADVYADRGIDFEEYPYWSVTRISREWDLSGVYCSSDVPDEASLRADVFTRLAWGAKGIVYYPFMFTYDDSTWYDRGSHQCHPGVYDTSSWTSTTAWYDTSETSGEYRTMYYSTAMGDVYYWIKAVNADVLKIRDALGPAIWHEPVVDPISPILSRYTHRSLFISGLDILPGAPGGYENSVLATPLESPDSQERYLMIVNQSEQNGQNGLVGGPLSVSVTLDPDSLDGLGTYRFKDMLHDSVWTVDAQPGQGFGLDSLYLERGGVRFITINKAG